MRVILSTLVVWALVGCGTSPSGSSLKGTVNRVMVVLLGGNASCKPDSRGQRSPLGQDMYAPFRNLHDRMANENGWGVDWLLTCHNSDAAVKYVTSEAPTQILSMNLEDVAPKISEMVAANESDRLYVAGHSYGGWLALKAGLALPEDVKLDGLFTIDPISRPLCSFDNPAECNRAPRDITRDQRLFLSDRTDHWTNYWEDQTWYLHSGPMEEADENIKVATGHTGIDTHATVWTHLAGMVAGAYF
jgi:pimeloyl-ACP methyl ester carboxylesterase